MLLPADQGLDNKPPSQGHPTHRIPADNAHPNHHNSFNGHSRHAVETPASIPFSGQPSCYPVSPAGQYSINRFGKI